MRSTTYFQDKLCQQEEGMAVGNSLSLVVSNTFMEHSEEVADRLCGPVVRVPGYRSDMYCVSCEVRTEFMYEYVM
jgi:hypothetical protein